MRRIASPLPGLVAVVALVVVACGGSSAPALTDPTDILVQSLGTLEDATSVSLKLTVDGALPADALGGLLPGGSPGSGGTGGTLDIGGTTVEGDIDIANQEAKLEFAVPAMLNTTGEVIVADGKVYVKASLLGDKYQAFDLADLGGMVPGLPSPSASASPGASATTDPSEELRKALGELTTPPAKLPDERCGDTDCYRVQVKLDSADAAPLASLAPGVTGAATVDVWVRKNDLRPAQVTIAADAGTEGNVTATLTLSDWNATVDITAPPADQVTEGQLPGLGLSQ
jgi:hypothetical protein